MSSFSQQELQAIQERNRRVEMDKAWETSKTRIVSIMVITYLVAVVFLWFIGAAQPWLGAGMPVIGFFLSTVSLPFVKRWWTARYLSSFQSSK
jgi:uncharacterized membrane protein YkgB